MGGGLRELLGAGAMLAWAIAGMPAAWIAGMPVVGLIAELGRRAPWLAVPRSSGGSP